MGKGFNKDFLWGAASAAHQIEGAYLEDGKEMGIWDSFAQKPGYIAHGENGNIACDHYHRYKEDVAIMKELGLKSYRFSVSWPRVIPKGYGTVNEKGLQFYVDLVDELLDAGIEPMVTLFHWNLPTAAYELGGWENPEIVKWFEQYADVVSKALRGKVKYWITFNEPQLFIGAGLTSGAYAPFERKSTESLMKISKNFFLAHGKAVRKIRKNCDNAKIGMAPTGEVVIPEKAESECIEKARKKTFSMTKEGFTSSIAWWSDPVFTGVFPQEAKTYFSEILPEFTEEERRIITEPLDFYGFNIYQGGGEPDIPGGYDRYSYQGSPKTAMEWNVTPEVMYWCCKFLYERYGKPVMITENGMANYDWIALDGKVHDPNRIDFIHRYILSLKEAVKEGIPVLGYQYWSILDNYEWINGYDKRFGLVYVDYWTQKRTVKDSAYWYKEVIASNGEIL
ncbi:GH1 family beta-glucosidase [Ruminococcus sp. 5_1_39BFAA]|uniref:GH1 family beta-glucosidase n=1 Tax=Ruminococcus sp. 5_1_39BFAA TaxID=457412 RepID=UPI003562BC70